MDAAGIHRHTLPVLRPVLRAINVERKTTTREYALAKLNTTTTIVTKNSATVIIDIARNRRPFEINESTAAMTGAKQAKPDAHDM